MSLVTGTKLGRYEIRTQLGAGGMGEVYLAQDTKLDRKVALKILPADVASNRDRMDRFVREAKSAATLNHPNIAHIYEIGESDGTHYIAMEFIDGQTLRDKIHRDRAPLPKLLKYLIQVAQGLSKAHAAGIVHRDLKPDNIMITRDDYVKVLDFGLAKLVEPQRGFGSNESGSSEIATAVMQQPGLPARQTGWDSGHSTPGMVIGTIGYMSPEQAAGRVDEIDLRSDIFSFGCILFEAATGQRAFAGKDVLDSLHKIVHAPTPLLKDANPLAPAELQRVVRRCLAKEREKRYQSIKELAIELDDLEQELRGFTESEYSGRPTPATSASTSGMTRGDEGFRIAVLPFKVRDADPAVEVLADGLSEEIVTGLSRFRYLSVVTSTSAVRMKGEIENEGSLGAKLGTRYVLEGSIRKGGSAIRVSVQLVDTETGAQLWSETYNRDLQTSTIFSVQDDVAGRIVATVADSYGVLVHSMRAAIRKKEDADLTPVEWQFQYFAYREQITPSSHATLKSRLQQVAQMNVGQSDLWACLAQVYVDEYAFGFEDDATSLDRALAAGRRGVELDRANQFALVALAQVHFFRQDLAAFGPAAERAMALNPLNTDALGILGLQIVHTGEFERGTAIVRRAMALNPNHAGWMHFAPLWDHFHKGEYEQALECANRVDVPGLFWPFLVMASACGHLGRRTEAEAAVKDLLALDPEFAAHVRSNIESWHFASGLLEPLLEGLRQAGLEIANEQPTSTWVVPSLPSSETRVDEGFSVAVLPFKSSGTAAELKALAEGLSEDIVTGLSRFSYLRVIARGSTMRYANQTTDLRTVGKELGARYVMEGTLRHVSRKLRLAVQLVDATTGAHLWAENYEREFSPENIFELQDDLVPRIVSIVADWYGVLPHSMSESVRLKPPDKLSPYEALLRSFGYFENIAPEEHAIVRSSLERAVAQEPGNADGWAMLSMMYGEEHRFGFNVEPDSLGRSLGAARQAVEAAHANHFAWLALAQALFFLKEFDAFRDAAERAITLNPMDGSTVEYLGHLIAFSGDWDRGCELADRARQLNPNHPSWYWSVPFLDAYRKADYLSARRFLLKGNPQKNYLMQALLAAVQGQLGEREAANKAFREVLTMMPDFPLIGRSEFAKWYLPELVDQLMDGLRKAGLEIRDEESASTSLTPSLASSETRADEGFWVVVLPFKFTGSNTEVATLAEGLSEEIVTGLSRFSYLRVISRSSPLRYASETSDVRSVGRTLGARYVMEGSLRLAGSSLRVSVQLVDSSTGAHLWAETYNRQFRAEDIFALQDDLVPRIVSTVADINGVLPRSMSEAVCSRSPDELTPYEAVLRSFRYFDRVTPEELTSARSCLEIAVEKAPTYADAWAMLALLCVQDYAQGFNLRPDSLTRGTMAARRAVEAAPSNHLAHFSLAQARFFQKELQSFRNAAERAVALNPMDGNSLAFIGELLTYVGDEERGLALATRAKEINPNHPGWFWYADFFHAYRQGDYRGALDLILKTNLPGHWGMHAGIAAAAGQLGNHEAAGKAIRDLLKLRPDFCRTVHNELSKWFDRELREHLIDGLRKAGLEIVGEEPAVHHVSSEIRADEGFWIAVLPFKVVGPGTELETLALGMTEEIVTGFSRFSYLRVMALGSTKKHAQSGDLRRIGAELGARYVMEGSIRQAGSTVRLAVQLVDASNGAHLWAETFDRDFQLDQIFAMQDELIPRIVSTCADHFGVLARSISDAIRGKESSQLSPYEALMRGFGYHYRLNPQEHAEARDILEEAVKEAPNNADCWAMLSWVYSHEYGHGFNTQPGSLDRALAAARRAVDLAPTNHLAYQTLAVALFFRKERANCLSAAERALALNPLDASNEAIFLITFVDDWERGCSLIRRAMDLNPYVPGWYRVILALNEYRKGNYREAVDETVKANAPGIWTDIVLSAAYAQLGEQAAARNALSNLLAENSAESARELLTKWFDEELVEHLVVGLRKAGFEIGADKSTTSSTATSEATSATTEIADEKLGETIAASGFEGRPAIAVLPFDNRSSDPEQEYFADGLAEDLITRLSLWRSFPVIARNSSFVYKGKAVDVKKVSADLGVRYVVEGSVRKAGNQVRIAAQLIDASTGQHVWAKTYDRELTDVFAVQDEISGAIAASLVGDLQRAEHQRAQRRAPENLEAWGLYQRALPLLYRFTREDSNQARALLERATALDPQFSTALARLAELGVWEFIFAWTDSPQQTLDGAVAQARRAVDLDPTDAEARSELAFALMTAGFGDAALEAALHGLDLNPCLPFALIVEGYLRNLSGNPPEESIELMERAMRLSPHDPAEFLFFDVLSAAYMNAGRYAEGLAAGRRLVALLPSYYWGYLWSAMNAVGLGRHEEARAMIRDARQVHPGLSLALARQALGAMAPDVERRFTEALRQAGLEENNEETRI